MPRKITFNIRLKYCMIITSGIIVDTNWISTCRVIISLLLWSNMTSVPSQHSMTSSRHHLQLPGNRQIFSFTSLVLENYVLNLSLLYDKATFHFLSCCCYRSIQTVQFYFIYCTSIKIVDICSEHFIIKQVIQFHNMGI